MRQILHEHRTQFHGLLRGNGEGRGGKEKEMGEEGGKEKKGREGGAPLAGFMG